MDARSRVILRPSQDPRPPLTSALALALLGTQAVKDGPNQNHKSKIHDGPSSRRMAPPTTRFICCLRRQR